MLPGRGRLFAGYQELEVCGLMDPARDIGGDLYDAFFIAPRRLALTIGDVSGKGIPAALFMARVIAQLRQVAMSETSPAALMARLNASLCEQNEAGMFVTLIYLVYDLDSGEYLYSNAGHNPPAVIGNGRCTYLDPPKGLVAGMMGEARYLQKAGTLAPGHTLMLYTDGVTEAFDPAGALYGEDRFASGLAATSEPGAAALVTQARLSVDLHASGAAQSDDITFLALRRVL